MLVVVWQVRPADVHTERENKLFIGMLPKTVDEALLEAIFSPFGKIKEIHVIRTPEVRPTQHSIQAYLSLVQQQGALRGGGAAPTAASA